MFTSFRVPITRSDATSGTGTQPAAVVADCGLSVVGNGSAEGIEGHPQALRGWENDRIIEVADRGGAYVIDMGLRRSGLEDDLVAPRVVRAVRHATQSVLVGRAVLDVRALFVARGS